MINNAFIRTLIQLIPMECFLITYTIVHDWYYAFLVGGVMALLLMGVFWIKNIVIERFILALNLFLIVGMIGLWGKISLIEQWYEQYTTTMVFIWLCVIGVITTIATNNGFINKTNVSHTKIRRYSLYLLAVAVVATIASYFMRGSFLLSATAPFAFFRIVQEMLEKQMDQSH